MTSVTIYHNPHCSKSRQTLALLEQQGIKLEVVYYLENPLTVAELRILIKQLGLHSARELMRTQQDCYQDLGLDQLDISENELLQAMVTHPELIERPIVVCNNQARLGRPPESVLDII